MYSFMHYTHFIFEKSEAGSVVLVIDNQSPRLHSPLGPTIVHVREARFVVYVFKVHFVTGNLQIHKHAVSSRLASSPSLPHDSILRKLTKVFRASSPARCSRYH
jgi:hypothetical protein